MDYIREFDIRLEKEMYYAGETLVGHVVLDTVENFKLRGKLLFNSSISVFFFVLIPLFVYLKCTVYRFTLSAVHGNKGTQVTRSCYPGGFVNIHFCAMMTHNHMLPNK